MDRFGRVCLRLGPRQTLGGVDRRCLHSRGRDTVTVCRLAAWRHVEAAGDVQKSLLPAAEHDEYVEWQRRPDAD